MSFPYMPRYRCHKEVRAVKIREVVLGMDGGADLLVPDDENTPAFQVSADYMEKHRPRAGGYFVLYDDEYASYSPAKPFEDGYTRID